MSTERELALIQLDHSYAKPWNWRPEALPVIKPAKSLFMTRQPGPPYSLALPVNTDEEIDVLTPIAPNKNPLEEKTQQIMTECERFADLVNPDVKSLAQVEDWEERVCKDSWTTAQHRLFNRVLKVFHADRLARLAQDSHPREPIQRRLVIDKTAKRVRLLLAQILWDPKLTHWLHNALCDNLPREYIAIYLDVLQTLRKKVPELIDKLLAGRVHPDQYGSCTKEGFRLLMKRKWDPTVAEYLHAPKIKKLPNNPFIILTPSAPQDNSQLSSRAQMWTKMLMTVGKLVTITLPTLKEADSAEVQKTEISRFIQRVVSVTITRIRDIKRSGHQDRPIFLFGWGVAAAINCQIASMETVSGCVCLGFPLSTLAGMRGEVDDPCLLDIKSPVLFVAGQNAVDCKPDDLEDVREKMRCESGLVLVGGADFQLRVSKHKKKAEAITQSMVDRAIMDEIREFLQNLMVPTVPAPTAVQMQATVMMDGSPMPTVAKKPARPRKKREEGSPAPKRAKSNKTKAALATAALNAANNGNPTSTPPMPIVGASITPTGDSSVVGVGSIATSTPVRSIPGIDVTKARKALEMGDTSSPLLSSALTSPTKTTALSGLKTTPTFTTPLLAHSSGISVSKGSRVARPMVPIGLPTTPVPASTISNYISGSSSPIPSGSVPSGMSHSSLTRPLPTPLVTSRIVSPPKVGSPSSTIIKTVSGAISSPPVSTPPTTKRITPQSELSTSNMIFLSQSAGGGNLTMAQRIVTTLPATASTPSIKTAASTPNQTLTVPSSLAQSLGVKKPGGGSKESLYIVAVPPDQIKNLESNNLIQYSGPKGNQMVALLSPEKGTPPSSANKVINVSADMKQSTNTTADGQGTEKRNVAEILASLSGLTPDPPKADISKIVKTINLPESTSVRPISMTPPVSSGASTPITNAPPTSSSSVMAVKSSPGRSTASILSSGGGRVVRVLTTSGNRTMQQSPSIIRSPSGSSVASATVSSSPSTSGGTNRSRKQVFVTQEKTEESTSPSTSMSKAEKAPEVITSVTTGDVAVVKEDDGAKIQKIKETHIGEKDILEEDMDDQEYVPYQKKPKKVTRSSTSSSKN
eukprot:TCALIF_00039-PA protein Name:"Similar to Kansl3 KAT8 regulatory NSL complex subunit 3 (Mus musculus)" AED:0.34 eAED:0.40 QI:0/0/0/0.5/1/1/8/0/1090